MQVVIGAGDLEPSKATEKGTLQPSGGPAKRKKAMNLALLIEAGLLEEGAVLRYMKVQHEWIALSSGNEELELFAYACLHMPAHASS